MRWSTVWIAAVVPFQLCGQDGRTASTAAATITPADLYQRISVLAHDSMKGRHTRRPEIEIAARYIADEFEKIGLAPAGEQGTFLQRYAWEDVRIDTAASRIAPEQGPIWRFERDFLLATQELPDLDFTGSVVVVTGVPDSATAKRLAVSGTIVVFVASTSSGASMESMDAALAGLRAGGPAVILLPVTAPDSIWRLLATRGRQILTRRSWETAAAPLLLVRERIVSPVLAPHGVSLPAARSAAHPMRATPVPVRLSVRLRATVVSRTSAPNVAGMLAGSDPALRNEYLVFSAHLDHIGVTQRGAAAGDSINNGADDDASGTAAVLELAEAFASLPRAPRRSLIFLTVSGEELGLYGSAAFAARPPVPIEEIVANLNIDMIGRNWKDTIVAIGKEHSDLGATLHRVAAAHPELRMTPIDDPWPQESFYTRSDHYNFARRGVPVLFFFSGTHEDYHRPGDHVDKIDTEKESRIVRLIFYLGLEIANAATRPRWNPESYRQIVEGGAR